MKILNGVLALAMAAVSVSATTAAPPAPRAHAAPIPHHGCCCPDCPGPGLCPCDPGSTVACLRSSDDLGRDVASSRALPVLKLACDLPWPLPRLGLDKWRDGVDRSPHPEFTSSPIDKVPISFA